MSTIYYAVVEDDPLTSGKSSRVFALKHCGTIEGEDGKRRRLAFIGDQAYCPKCDSTGVITYGVGLGDRHRLIDLFHGGRRQAVGGDVVLCKCADRPRVIAIYGTSWRITDRGEETRPPVARAAVQNLAYDEQFTLTDAAGKALADTFYTVRLPSGQLQHGVTDSDGLTVRHKTNGAQSIAVYLGHRESIA